MYCTWTVQEWIVAPPPPALCTESELICLVLNGGWANPAS